MGHEAGRYLPVEGVEAEQKGMLRKTQRRESNIKIIQASALGQNDHYILDIAPIFPGSEICRLWLSGLFPEGRRFEARLLIGEPVLAVRGMTDAILNG
jgi:hypothetical protein